MKKQLIAILSSIVILLLLCTGAFVEIVNFFCWLFLLQNAQPEISVAGGIIVRIITFLVAYGLVGLIFDLFGFFNSGLMKIMYFIISSLLGFALAYIVWSIEQYILIVGIIFGVILFSIIIFFVIKLLLKRSNERFKK